jgi:hypothetical protein
MAYQLIFRPGKSEPERTERLTRPTLAEMQAAVGGLIQGACELHVDGLKAQVWVDEEGLLKPKPQVNIPLLEWLAKHGVRLRQPLVGPALVLVGSELPAG